MRIDRVNDIRLEEAIVNGDKWVLAAFWSCDYPPSTHFLPEYFGLSKHLGADAFLMLMIHLAEHPGTVATFGIQAIPTTILFRRSEELRRWEGPYSRETLLDGIISIIKEKGAR